MVEPVARSSTTSDVFNAIAEAHRREILDALMAGEKAVGAIVGLAKYEQAWNDRLDQVDDYLKELQQQSYNNKESGSDT